MCHSKKMCQTIAMPRAWYGFNLTSSLDSSVTKVSIRSGPHTLNCCLEFNFSAIDTQIVFLAASTIAFFTCTTSQSLSVIPIFASRPFTPDIQRSARISLIREMTSPPTHILADLDILSPIRITSIEGCCPNASAAGILVVMNVA